VSELTYRRTKAGTVFVAWRGRTVTTLRGDAGRRFVARAEGLDSDRLQLLLAQVTGNFKRGNER
jgi:hypothetical protein